MRARNQASLTRAAPGLPRSRPPGGSQRPEQQNCSGLVLPSGGWHETLGEPDLQACHLPFLFRGSHTGPALPSPPYHGLCVSIQNSVSSASAPCSHTDASSLNSAPLPSLSPRYLRTRLSPSQSCFLLLFSASCFGTGGDFLKQPQS